MSKRDKKLNEKNIITLHSVFLLAGCAQTKPQMPDANYEKFAKVEVASDACLNSNFITAQEAGQAHSNISLFLSSWTYDYVRYSNLLAQGHQDVKKNQDNTGRLQPFARKNLSRHHRGTEI
ncbi:hypothetical protein A9T60_023825 (plasmid) [Salmonella enterica subsp. enterica serovar Hadar]